MSDSFGMSDAVFVNQVFDCVGMTQTAHFNLDACIGRATHADLASIEQSLKERLLQLDVANVTVPNFRDRPTEPTTMQSGSQIGDGQFGAATAQVPDQHDWDSNSNERERRIPSTKPIGLLRNMEGEATYTVFSFDMVNSYESGKAFKGSGPRQRQVGREFHHEHLRSGSTVKTGISPLKMQLLLTVPGDETAVFQ